MPDAANTEQVRIMADAVAKAAVLEFARQHPELNKQPLPALFKWIAGITAVVLSSMLIGYFTWLTTGVTNMRDTLTRMEAREMGKNENLDLRLMEFERRIDVLESYHAVDRRLAQ